MKTDVELKKIADQVIDLSIDAATKTIEGQAIMSCLTPEEQKRVQQLVKDDPKAVELAALSMKIQQ